MSVIQNPALISKFEEFNYEFSDIPATPNVIDKCTLKKIVKTENDQVVSTRCQILIQNPYYVSVDCDVINLQSVIDALQYIYNNTV